MTQDGSLANPFCSIGQGVAAASLPGDTVEVAPGDYTGIDNRDVLISRFIGHSTCVVVRCTAPSEACVIDADSLGRAFVIESDGTGCIPVIEGFTIRRGLADFKTGVGGGVFVRGDAVIRDCRFEANQANSNGGAIYHDAGVLKVQRCVFLENNSSPFGGGIGTKGGTQEVSDCVFEQNSSGYQGGGAYFQASISSVRTSTFRGNTATNEGGGIYAESAGAKGIALTIRNCTFEQNVAGRGAALSTLGVDTEVLNTMIVQNAATDTEPRGGAIHVFHNSISLTNCTVADNRADNATVNIGAGAGLTSAAGTITNCIFWNNYPLSPRENGAQLLVRPGTVAPPTVISYSDIHGGLSSIDRVPENGVEYGVETGPLSTNIGIFEADHYPKFVAPTSGDYSLGFLSPCIDSGNSPIVPFDTDDLDGDGDTLERVPDRALAARVVQDPHAQDQGVPLEENCTVVDMGAFEAAALPDCPAATVLHAQPPNVQPPYALDHWVIDARQPHPLNDSSLAARQGLGSSAEPLRVTLGSQGSGDPGCWTLCEARPEVGESGPLDDNEIVSINELPGSVPGQFDYSIVLARPISAKQCTTVTYRGDQEGCGHATFCSLPADCDSNGTADPHDVTNLYNYLFNVAPAPNGLYSTDLDRSMGANLLDVLRAIDLLCGANAYVPFMGMLLVRNCYGEARVPGPLDGPPTDCPAECFAQLCGVNRADPFADPEGFAAWMLALGDACAGCTGPQPNPPGDPPGSPGGGAPSKGGVVLPATLPIHP